MPVTAVRHQKPDQRAHSANVRAVNDGAALARSTDETGARQNGEMGGQGILLRADRFGDRARGETARLVTHEKPKDFEPRRLSERGES